MTAPIDITPGATPPSGADKLLARLGSIAGGLGIALALIGLLVIGLGWNSAAEKITTVQQMPYLLSAGFFGLGLVVLGAAVLVADSHRRDRAELAVRLEALIELQQTSHVVHLGGGPAPTSGAEGFAPLPRIPRVG
jgi:hypothetical protein